LKPATRLPRCRWRTILQADQARIVIGAKIVLGNAADGLAVLIGENDLQIARLCAAGRKFSTDSGTSIYDSEW
jgi:hypothetical protein